MFVHVPRWCQCRTPRHSAHPSLCWFHARQEAQARAAAEFSRDISSRLSGNYLSACDLTSALSRLFTAVAQGHVQPKAATALAYLGQTLVQSIPLAQHEYINAFGADFWRKTVRACFPYKPRAASNAQPGPAASPKQPLPPTGAAFVDAALAGLAQDRASDKE